MAQIKRTCDTGQYSDHTYTTTSKMNPIEQIWKQIGTMGFRNERVHPFADVVNRLCEMINDLTKEIVKSITHRDGLLL